MDKKRKIIISFSVFIGICSLILLVRIINPQSNRIKREIKTVEFIKQDIDSNLFIDSKDILIPFNDKENIQMIDLDNKNVYYQYQVNEETSFGMYNRENGECKSIYNMPKEVYAFLSPVIIDSNVYILESYRRVSF